ncbi:histone-lysine N-methyltransferase SETMAR [Trichonephila clavipes]|nr:histone-lysine N-methyltransferase SETMAR [Trichonephila clavipes]
MGIKIVIPANSSDVIENNYTNGNSTYCIEFFFDKDENARQGAEIVNSVYGANTVTANCVQFWFCRFHSGIFDFKDAPRPCRTVIENVDKITEIIKVDRHVPHQLTPKDMMDRISIWKALAKWNEIDPFLKWIVAEDKNWVTYDNIV